MSKRLKILFSQERGVNSAFSTKEIATLFGKTSKEIKKLAKKEHWASFDQKEINPNGGIESFPMWDAFSMPYETRKKIAMLHYYEEDEEKDLYIEAEEETAKVRALFPWADDESLTEAFLCNRLFTYAVDVVMSLHLKLVDALEVVCLACNINYTGIRMFYANFDNDDPRSFILLDEDTRFAVLLLYFLRDVGALAHVASNTNVESATEQVQ